MEEGASLHCFLHSTLSAAVGRSQSSSQPSPDWDSTIPTARIVLSPIMVHVKYPSMERQDLTQGQLGSFKFTPVDEVYPDAVMFPQPHPLLVKQYIQSLKTAGLNDERFRRPTTASSSGPSSHDCDVNPALYHSRFRPRSVISQPGVGSRAIDAHGHVQEKVLSSYVSTIDFDLLTWRLIRSRGKLLILDCCGCPMIQDMNRRTLPSTRVAAKLIAVTLSARVS